MKTAKMLYRLIDSMFIRSRHYVVMNQETRNKKRVFIGNKKDFDNILKNGVELSK